MSNAESVRGSSTRAFPGARILSLLVCVLLPEVACGPVEETSGTAEPSAPGVVRQEQAVDNGLSFNGLSFNGLSFNGLSFNGLSFNGLSNSAFSNWFNSNPTLADEVMRYVVRCALPAGQIRTYRDQASGRTFTWPGELGLSPGWAGGAPATVTEQQLVSACLAAHANKYRVVVPISVLGRNGQDQPVSFSLQELAAYPKQEGCFFGNLFTGQGVFVGSEGHMVGDSQSSARACAIASTSHNGPRTPCAPIVHIGDCSDACARTLPLDPYYSRCVYGGVTYRPLTTRLRDQDIYNCGDGTCQVSESCGTGSRYDACRDCPCN